MVDFEDNEEEGFEIEELNDYDFAYEHGRAATCIVQRLLCNQMADTTQQHRVFYSRCSVKSKVCNLIIDNESYENIVSKALVDYLKLEIESHPHPYNISWIKKGNSIKITDLYHVHISTDIFYRDLLLVMWLLWTYVILFGETMTT